jgi:NADPH2:quinone reductase
VNFEKAAGSPLVSFTAYKLLADVGRLQPGETVLIHAAAGGIGTTAIQLAKLLGASSVIGTVGSQSKVSAALEAGADHVICIETKDFVQEVNTLTNGSGVDVVLDSISGKVAEKSLECLESYGRLVNFGNASGDFGQFITKDLHASCRGQHVITANIFVVRELGKNWGRESFASPFACCGLTPFGIHRL